MMLIAGMSHTKTYLGIEMYCTGIHLQLYSRLCLFVHDPVHVTELSFHFALTLVPDQCHATRHSVHCSAYIGYISKFKKKMFILYLYLFLLAYFYKIFF